MQSFTDPARDWALHCLCEFESRSISIERELDRLGASELSERDRRFARQLVLGTVRWLLRIDWVVDRFARKPIASAPAVLRQALRLGTYQILWLDRVPDHAAVNTSVELVRRFGQGGLVGAVNGILREVSRRGAETELPPIRDLHRHLSVRYSHPQWLVEKWLRQRSRADTESLLAAQAQQSRLYLRHNPLCGAESELLELLEAEGRTLTPAGMLGGFHTVSPAEGLFSSPAFQDGRFQIQDINAALPVALLDPHPEEEILDLFAAPGGKTTQLAETMDDRGRVVAADRSAARLRLVRDNARRLKQRSVHTAAFDARAPALGEATFDRVLADVPCSGTGVLGRHPEFRWEKRPEQLPDLASLQAKTLRQAFALVRPGGVLVYSTCSLEPEENSRVVEQFLETTDAAELEPARTALPHLEVADRYVETVPGRNPGDGIFAARIRKTS